MSGEYRLEAKIRNANILRALERIGETPYSFAKKHGLSKSRMCGIVAMKIRPTNAKGEWWPEVLELCGATRKMPSSLFTEKQMHGLETTKAQADVSEQEIEYRVAEFERLLIDTKPAEDRVDNIELASKLFNHLLETHPRRAKAVALSQAGATHEEVGAALGVSKDRARQLIIDGYRRMKERSINVFDVTEFPQRNDLASLQIVPPKKVDRRDGREPP